MNRSRWVWLGVLSGVVGTAAACGGDDTPTFSLDDAGSDGGGFDVNVPDTTLPTPDASDASDAGGNDAANDVQDATTDAADAASDAPTDGPRTLDGALCSGQAIAVSRVVPPFGWTGSATPLTISGAGFVATPKVYLRNTSTQVLTPIVHSAFVSSTSITAIVPSGLPVATYDVGVENPDTCASYLTSAFKVVANAPPVVVSVSPAAGTTQVNTNVTVTGCHFPTNATLSTVDPAGTIAAQTAQMPTCTGPTNVCADGSALCTMQGTIASTTLAVGAYVVRVGNPTDATYGDYASFVVTNPSQKLTGGYTSAPALNTGRRALGLVSGRIDDANRFLYAVGGEDSGGVALATIEVAPLDRYGQLGAWFVQRNSMKVARSGLSVVRQGKYLYALGGTSATNDGTKGTAPTGTPLATVERAKILDASTAPVLTDPATVSTASGSLAKGTWYYKVAAVMGAGDADNPSGETLPSDEVVATLSALGNVSLTWTAVPGADHYRVYRSPVADGASQSEVLIKDNLAGTSYNDTGDTAGSVVPLRAGSTGVWVSATSLLHARLNAAAAIGPDGSGGSRLYVTGGWGACTGVTNALMDCSESTSVTAAGDALGGVFTAAPTPMGTARMRHGISVLTGANAPSDAGAGAEFVVVGGGYATGITSGALEYAPITNLVTGLGTWTAANASFTQQRDGTQIYIVNGEAYDFMGGTAPNQYKGTGFLSALGAVSTSSISFGSWSSSAVDLPSNAVLGRFGLTLESAYFYVVGGTSNDTDALTTVYQILY